MRSKSILGLAIIAAAAIGGTSLSYLHTYLRENHAACMAGPDEVCPSDIQLKEVGEVKAIEAKWSKVVDGFKDDRVRYNGLLKDFSDGAPKGFQWDDKKARWVKSPPVAQAPPASPVPGAPLPPAVK